MVAGPMPLDLVELVDRGDAAVLVAEVDDVLRGHRADALDRVELLDGGRAEADRAVAPRRRATGAGRRRPPAVGALAGTITTCWPSASRAARLIASTRRLRGRAARALDRVVDARAGGQPVDARLAHRAGDVDDHVLAAVGSTLERRRPEPDEPDA